MSVTRLEALAEAKVLARTLGSAPDPLKQARAVVAVLGRSGPWSAADERRILAFAEWLATRPPPIALKPRCQQLLKELA